MTHKKTSFNTLNLKIAVIAFALTVVTAFLPDYIAALQTNDGLTAIDTVVPLVNTASLPSSEHPLDTIQVPVAAVTVDKTTVANAPIAYTSNNYGTIDWTHGQDGYIEVEYTAATETRIKCTVTGPDDTKYVYDITPGQETTLSLSAGTGDYTVCLLENTVGITYKVMTKASFTANIDDEILPFLTSNPYTDWANAPETVAMAAALTENCNTDLERVNAIYDYVVENLTYDYHKAETVAAGYLPDLDSILAAKTGICFDYASLTAGMLRSQGIPCKLVIGYAGSTYHAWISVYSGETGWVENSIYFSEGEWCRMDPTFASTSNRSAYIMRYIGDGENYLATEYY